MATQVERFLKGTNNLVKLQLLEDGQPVDISVATQVDINIGGFLITRTSSVDGVDFSDGNLTINPAQLTEDLSSLPNQWLPTAITIYDIQNTDGARFGGADSDPRLMFSVRP